MNQAAKNPCTVTWHGHDRVGEFTTGTLLLDAARHTKVDVAAPCNGAGTCGKCRVRVADQSGLSPLADDERARLSPAEIAAGVRLACRAIVVGDVTVEPLDRATSRTAVLGEGTQRAFARDTYAELPTRQLGVAIDIGTTTVAVGVLDLVSGREIGSASAVNPQTAYGHDVLTRVLHGASAEGMARLSAAVRECVDDAVAEACASAGVSQDAVHGFAVAANTVMTHLLLAIDVSGLGRAPYTPTDPAPAPVAAAELGWRAAPSAEVFCVPAVSAFVGGDIVAGLLATGLPLDERLTLFVDMGTNGEIVLGSSEQLWACSCAAGPAFEGMGIASGMRAAPGAIDSASIDAGGDIRVTTIGDKPPLGLCGSGVIDAAAALLEAGVFGASGRFVRDAGEAPWGHRLRSHPARLVLADGPSGEIAFNQHDVRAVQLAKGAIASGISALLTAAAAQTESIERVLIAGQFGHHVRRESLAALGLVPAELAHRIEVVGNTSKSGAAMCLLSAEERARSASIATGITHVELSTLPGFDRLLADCMAFPRIANFRLTASD